MRILLAILALGIFLFYSGSAAATFSEPHAVAGQTAGRFRAIGN